MAAPPLITYTVPLTCEQVAALRQLLESAGFEFSPKPYTIFFAQKNKLSVAVYEKGPKLLLQGKGIEEFVSFELEPKILGEARLGYEEEVLERSFPEYADYRKRTFRLIPYVY